MGILILSIGINNYPKLPDFLQLNFCMNDARLIYNNYSQLKFEYKKLLLNENATKTEILKDIKDLSDDAREEDYIIFYFAGHGFTTSLETQEINAKNSYICPFDFEVNYHEQTGISLFELKNTISLIKSSSKLIIFDSCHSGGVFRRELQEFNLRYIKIKELIDIMGTIQGTGIITACDSDESAIENAELEHGVFTYYFIESLKEIDTDNHIASFSEVHKLVKEKVKNKTDNKQNPQAKGDDEFKVVTLPRVDSQSEKKVISDITIVPTPTITKASEYYKSEDLNEFENGIIQLIQEDRFVELDRIFKQVIATIYNKISNPEISYDNRNNEEIIAYYESCREYLKPLLILNQLVLDYYNEKYVVENLEYVLRLEQLTHNKNGLVAIIQIPLILISEIIINLLPLAYSKKKITVLKKLYDYKITNSYGFTLPLIFEPSLYHPEIFDRDTNLFIKYLIPEESNNGLDMFLDYRINNLTEINLFYDSLSTLDDVYGSYPMYLIFDDRTTLRRISSKLSDKEFISFIEKVFSIEIEDLLNHIIKRQNEILGWSEKDPFLSHSLRSSIEVFEKLKSDLVSPVRA